MNNRTLELESSIKTIIGEIESRIELIEGYKRHQPHTIGKLSAYKEFIIMLEDILK